MQAVDSSYDLEFQRRRAALQGKRFSAFEPRTLAWLALPPGWTFELARACRFPIEQGNLDDFILQAQSTGLIHAENDGDRIIDFWMLPGERSSLLEWLNQHWDRGILLKTAWEIGRLIQSYLPPDKYASPQGARKQIQATQHRAATTPIQVPENIARWATLASMIIEPPQLTAWLDEQVMALLDQEASGEAIAWLDIARELVYLGGDTLERAVIQGTHRLQLVYRRSMEARLLASSLVRPEQMEPFYQLLCNDGQVWALHYLGIGGVGKTTLLRYISAGCPDPEKKYPRLPRPYLSCRVDFDYIPPTFPFKKPGQLLLDLVAELRLQGVRSDILRQFNLEVDELHRMMSSQESSFDLARLMESDEQLNVQFRRMLTTFYRLIQEVYQEKEGMLVILILDTCEELAKIPAPGGQLLAVEGTFYILETLRAIHDEQNPGKPLPFRVIFSGRRVLAQRGPGWHLKEGQAGGKRGLLPANKTYLAMHELRGFDYPDLKRFLCEKKHIPAVSFPTYRAILCNSQEMGQSAEVVFDHPSYREQSHRYNPFDVNLFADWLLDSPETSAQEITSSIDDPYIEYRILKRLHSQTLINLLPYLVMLDRVDESLLRPLFKALGEENYDEAFRELGDQEWIDYISTEEQRKIVLRIDSNFQPRLQRYYNLEDFARLVMKTLRRRQEIPEERKKQVQAAKNLLAPLLNALILRQDGQESYRLDQLNSSCLDTALRLLPPEEAAQVWESVERRIPAELDWMTAPQYMEGVLVSENGETLHHPIWAGVQAMRAAIELHAKAKSDRSGRWQAVLESAGRYPEGPGRERLVLRARLGTYATARLGPDGSLPKDWNLAEVLETILSVWEALPEPNSLPTGLPIGVQQMAASAAAALENVIELIQYGQIQGKYPPMMVEVDRLQALEARLSPSLLHADLSAFARSLVGRLLLLKGERGLAWQVLRRAARSWQEAPPASREIWQDWQPAKSLSSRLRLEALRALPVVLSPEDEDDLGTWRDNAVPADGNWDVDRERLASNCLLEELKRRPVKREVIERFRASWGWDGATYPAECFAHKQTPHLLLALGRAYLALGLGQEAMGLLSEKMNSAKKDETSQEEICQGLLGCMRRLRLYKEYTWINGWVESVRFDQAAMAWPAELLNGGRVLNARAQTGLPSPKNPAPEWQHLWNQLQRTRNDFLLERASQLPLSPETSYAQQALVMDLIEKNPPTSTGSVDLDFQAWLRFHPGQEENALRLALQADYLANVPNLLSPSLMTNPLTNSVIRSPGVEDRSILTNLPSPIGAHQSPESLAPNLPARRRAEIALEEGELLALRNPYGGRAVLKLAQGWFEEAGDSFGVLQASLCAALARLRMDLKAQDVTGEMEETIRPAYEACRINNPSLPELAVLLAKAATGLAGFFEATAPDPSWRTWIDFLLTVQWSPGASGINLVQAIQDPNAQVRLPEIDFIGKKASQDNTWKWVLGSCVIILALLGIGGYLIYLAYKGLNSALSKVSLLPGVSSGWKVILFILLICLVIFGIVRLVQRIVGIGRLVLKGPGQKKRPAYDLIRSYFKLRLGPMVIGRKDLSWHWEGNVIYRMKSEGPQPEKFTEAFNHMKRLAGNPTVRHLPFEIAINTPKEQSISLEQTWVLLLDNKKPERVFKRFDLYRATRGNDDNNLWAAVGWGLGLVRVVCNASIEQVIHQAWEGQASGITFGTPPQGMLTDIPNAPFDLREVTDKSSNQAQQRLLDYLLNKKLSQEELDQVLTQKYRSTRSNAKGKKPLDSKDREVLLVPPSRGWGQLLQRISLARPDIQLPCRVLHLVGSPASSTVGLAWQVVSASDIENAYQSLSKGGGDSDTMTAFASQFSSTGASTLIPLSSLPGSLAGLVIVQGEPSQDPISFLLDRNRNDNLRAAGYQLAALGAPAVLVLPSLPDSWTIPILRAVIKAIQGRHPPDERRLLKAAAAARRAIIGQPLPGTEKGTDAKSDPKETQIDERLLLSMHVCLILRKKQPAEEEKPTRVRKA